MATVVIVNHQFCVAHDLTKAVLKRKGVPVCYPTRAQAQRDATATRERVMGKMPRSRR